MGIHYPLMHGQFGPQRLDWQDLCRGPLTIATYKIFKPWASWFERRSFFVFVFFLSFSHYKSMGAISRHGGHLDLRTVTIFTNIQSPFNKAPHKVGRNLAQGLQRRSRSKVWADGGRTENDHKSSSWACLWLRWAKNQLKIIKRCVSRRGGTIEMTFVFLCVILSVCVSITYLVPLAPPTSFTGYFWNFEDFFLSIWMYMWAWFFLSNYFWLRYYPSELRNSNFKGCVHNSSYIFNWILLKVHVFCHYMKICMWFWIVWIVQSVSKSHWWGFISRKCASRPVL